MIFELKLALIVWMGFSLLAFVALIIIIRAVGNINHVVNPVEDSVPNEVVLNFYRKLMNIKADIQRKIADVERKKIVTKLCLTFNSQNFN